MEREYIQGYVALVGTSPESGGYCVVPRSHHRFEELAPIPRELPGTERAELIAKEGIVPHVPAGGLLMWDSRVLHCNAPGVPSTGADAGRAAQPELLRCAVMVCMSPMRLATPAVRAQHRWALENGLCLNHMAHHLTQGSERWKHDVGFSRVAPVPLEELSDEGKAILG